MPTTKEEGAVPDFLRMDQPISSDPANAKKTGNWHGWPTKDMVPVTLCDDEGRTVRIRTPVMDLEGLITPTDLHYTVQHFDVPPVIESDKWEVQIGGEVKNPLTLNFDQLRRFPARSVRTVMECSGSDATFFEYFKGEGPRPSRTQEGMILSASEWTGAYSAFLSNSFAELFPIPPGSSTLELILNSDPDIARELEVERNRRQAEQNLESRFESVLEQRRREMREQGGR